VTATLEGWGADALVDDAVLLVSELVTNAVLHAGTDIEVALHLEGGCLRVDVRDGDPRAPSVRHYSTLSGTGRGLALVDQLARRWSIDPSPDGTGKTVWFELEA
jgi:anti-sigma regulatory factor (Ser/Thr protein kinase)